MYDIKHFINNSDGEFHKQRVLDIVKSVYYDECKVKPSENKKTFKINKAYCVKHGITANQYKMVVRKKKNDESIGQWYDISKSLKENLEFAKENNIKVSRRTLYNFCERNGINTKGEKKEHETNTPQNTHNTMEESTQEKPIYELNKTQPTPQQIEDIIKNTYHSLEEFENNFDVIEKDLKSILNKDRINSYQSRWMQILMYYHTLKTTA